MIVEVLENLKTKEVISENKVDSLRSYIRGKYPEYTAGEISAIFADAINKIIDSSIGSFDEEERRDIRDSILRKAVGKKSFSIYADDVLASCLMLEKEDAEYIDRLAAWVNKSQELEVPREKLKEFVRKARQYENAVLFEQLHSIAGAIENAAVVSADQAPGLVEATRGAIDGEKPVLDAAETQWIEALSGLIESGHDDGAGAPSESKSMGFNVGEAALKAIKEVEANEAARVLAEVYSNSADSAGRAGAGGGTAPKRWTGPGNSTVMGEIKLLLQREAADLVHYLKYEARLSRFAFRMAVILAVLAAGMFVLQRSYGSSTYAGDFFIAPVDCIDISEDQLDRYPDLDSKIKYKVSSNDTLMLVKALRDGLHEELRYTEIDRASLKKWLAGKNSLLSEEPYFSAIIGTAKKYDIHPFLLFAITGQEQAFVPKNKSNAKKIANNPFNVYGSWQDYNTNIYDTSELAAKVIIKSSKDRPVYINAIKWINRKYAEDENWWKSVAAIFDKMKSEID